MLDRIDPTFFGDDIKLCRFCKKQVNFDTKFCPFCERDLFVSTDNLVEISSSTFSKKIHTAVLEDMLTYAGFWRRGAASIVDSFVLILIWILYFLMVDVVDPFDSSRFLVPYVFSMLFGFFYYTLFTYSSGSTPGKMLLGIKVVSGSDIDLTYARCVVRFFSYYLSTLLLFAGYLIQPFTARRQALHDFISNTLVVRFATVSIASPGLIWLLFVGLILFIPFFQFLTY